jgi:hypothetical protein
VCCEFAHAHSTILLDLGPILLHQRHFNSLHIPTDADTTNTTVSFNKNINKTMANNIPEAFQKGTLYTDDEVYKFLKFPTSVASSILQSLSSINKSNANNKCVQHFQAFMIDKDEVTVMLSSTQFQQFHQIHNNEEDNNDDINNISYQVGSLSYRLITFDVVLAPTLVGFMAIVTRALADAHISVLPFAAYSRDHIFVSQQDFDMALTVLQNLQTTTTTTSTP